MALGLAAAGCGAGGAAQTPAAASQTPPTVAAHATTSTQTTYTAKITIPQLTWAQDPAVATSVNSAVQSWAKQEQTTFASAVAKDLAAAKNLPAAVTHGNLTITYSVGLVNTKVASFKFNLDTIAPGQADNTQWTAGMTFNLRTGGQYTLAGLFQPGQGYVTTLATAAGKGLAAFTPSGAHCYLGQAPTAAAGNFAAWWLTSGGLVLSFPAGTYTAAYCGAPSVTVAYQTLKSLAASGSPLLGA